MITRDLEGETFSGVPLPRVVGCSKFAQDNKALTREMTQIKFGTPRRAFYVLRTNWGNCRATCIRPIGDMYVRPKVSLGWES